MKKVIIVKQTNQPHGQKQPERTARPGKKTFISRCIDIIINDIKAKFGGAPDGWEDYKRFCEMARGKR